MEFWKHARSASVTPYQHVAYAGGPLLYRPRGRKWGERGKEKEKRERRKRKEKEKDYSRLALVYLYRYIGLQIITTINKVWNRETGKTRRKEKAEHSAAK
jgi:hypothetical protein